MISIFSHYLSLIFRRTSWIGAHSACALTLLPLMAIALAQSAQAATVTTDKTDYPPGSLVTITGSDFGSGETVRVQVLHVGGALDNDTSAVHQPWEVGADADGSFQATWLVPIDQDEYGALLQVTATGLSSGLTASAMFTDGVAGIDFSQYVNGPDGKGPGAWIAGSINGQKAFYAEGMCVPQRLFLIDIAPTANNVHSLQLKVLASKGGNHAYDFV